MIDAIVYNSKCGHTYKYAKALSESLSLPLLNIKEAKRKLSKGNNIIYMSWVLENKIVSYDKVTRFHIDSVIAVGIMPESEDIVVTLKNENLLYSKLYYLQGGINKKKLGLRKRFKLKLIQDNMSFELLDSGLTQAKAIALDAIIHQLDFTDVNKLDRIIKNFVVEEKIIS